MAIDGMPNIRARMVAILTEGYGSEFPIPTSHFHALVSDRTIETTEIGDLERCFEVTWRDEKNPVIPVDRNSDRGYYDYPIKIRVGYRLTGKGETSWENVGASATQNGEATDEAVQDRALQDRQRIESAIGSFRNMGALSPIHVIDCKPVGGGGIQLLPDRAILTVPFVLQVRAPLAI